MDRIKLLLDEYFNYILEHKDPDFNSMEKIREMEIECHELYSKKRKRDKKL